MQKITIKNCCLLDVALDICDVSFKYGLHSIYEPRFFYLLISNECLFLILVAQYKVH